MSKEAMKLALEALEQYTNVVASVNNPDAWVTVVDAGKPAREAIAALREALAEQKSGIKQVIELYDSPDQPSPATPLREHEPVAWLSRDDARLALWEAINKREFGNPTDDKLILDHLREKGLWIGKYTSPPAQPAQRTWVGLTGSEITTSPLYSVTRDKGCFHAGALWAEAKLKEKNT